MINEIMKQKIKCQIVLFTIAKLLMKGVAFNISIHLWEVVLKNLENIYRQGFGLAEGARLPQHGEPRFES
jgi:hypothetical protein